MGRGYAALTPFAAPQNVRPASIAGAPRGHGARGWARRRQLLSGPLWTGGCVLVHSAPPSLSLAPALGLNVASIRVAPFPRSYAKLAKQPGRKPHYRARDAYQHICHRCAFLRSARSIGSCPGLMSGLVTPVGILTGHTRLGRSRRGVNEHHGLHTRGRASDVNSRVDGGVDIAARSCRDGADRLPGGTVSRSRD